MVDETTKQINERLSELIHKLRNAITPEKSKEILDLIKINLTILGIEDYAYYIRKELKKLND
jgi:hypothetical protein